MSDAVGRSSGIYRVMLAVICVLLLGWVMPARGVTFEDIPWTTGPATVKLGSVAELNMPAGYRFTGEAGAATFKALTHNVSQGEVGVLIPSAAEIAKSGIWFVMFRFDDSGYVKDDEALTSSAINSIMESIRTSTAQANEERKSKGWDTLDVVGWEQQPRYDAATHHLVWAIRGRGKEGDVINYNSRVLGRHGVLSVNMVVAPEVLASCVPSYNKMVENIAFVGGERYSEYQAGDKIAKYGLVGLITGVGAVAAVKLWKPLLVFGGVIVAGIAKFFRKIKGMITGSKA